MCEKCFRTSHGHFGAMWAQSHFGGEITVLELLGLKENSACTDVCLSFLLCPSKPNLKVNISKNLTVL